MHPAHDAPPFVEVLHRLPGRVRFRAAGIGGAAAARRLETCLNDAECIVTARVNPTTGSILVRHGGTFEEVAAAVAAYVLAYARRGQGGNRSAGAMASEARDGATAHEYRGARNQAWSTSSAQSVVEELASSQSAGLDDEEAAARLARCGPNEIETPPVPGPAVFLSRQLTTAPIAMLGAAAVVSVATGGIADAIGIAVAIGLNSIIGATTEWQSEMTIQGLSEPGEDTCAVRRAARVRSVASREVVPGDVLLLTPGEFVAADARLLLADRLTVDESALTGESMPVDKDALAVCNADTPLAERCNMVFKGTAVTGGNGAAIVVATGTATEMGQIQVTSEAARTPETPMEVQLRRLGRQLSWISVAACVAVLGVGLLRGGRVLDMVKAAVSLGVAAVPEGLPAVATTTLAIGLRNMRGKGLLVRNLSAVETIGAVDVVCMDKTGTLTRNRIVPAAVYVAMRRYSFGDGRLAHRDTGVAMQEHPELRLLLEFIALNNDSEVADNGGGRVLGGSPTENALLEMALAGGVDVADLRGRYPRLYTKYRSETEPFVTTLHRSGSRGRLLIVKGSPKEVLKLCTRVHVSKRRRLLDDETRAGILAENESWSGESLRVLGVAYDRFAGAEEPQSRKLTWLGLAGLTDPLREGMREMIADLHAAGIRTVMITGDQMGTAAAIGGQLSLSGEETLRVLDSRDLSKLTPDVLEALTRQAHVFARVSPANKLEIVQSLQRGGDVVAMTGDGINDGPALKAADVGIAMGQARNEVARSVADIVVDDDRLESVIAALAQGRAIYANVRKSIHYLVSTNLSEIELMLAASALGFGMPLSPMQLLWINLATDALPAIALGLEAPDAEVLRQPPRDRTEPIITPVRLRRMVRESAVITAAAMGSLMFGRARHGDAAAPRSMAFNTLIIAQLLHSFTCRSERPAWLTRAAPGENPTLAAAVGASLGLQAAALLVPAARRFLGTARLGLPDILFSSTAALAAVGINEVLKTQRPSPGRINNE